jgi:rod shape-determining protein MreD
MKYSSLLHFLFLVPALILQTFLVPFLSFNDIAPDLVLIFLVYITIKSTQMYGTIFGFFIGGICDLIFGTILGSTMISKTLAGFISGYFASENQRDVYLRPINFALIVFLVGIIDNSVFSFFSSFDLTDNFIANLLTTTILNSVYTAIVSLLVISSIPQRRSFESS